MELAGLSRDPDPTLCRHIYDLHMIRGFLDPATIAVLARDIAAADADEFRNQYPAYAADIVRLADSRRQAMLVLTQDQAFAQAVAHRTLKWNPATGGLTPVRRGWFS